jgi:rRNA maturation RNase YbeY
MIDIDISVEASRSTWLGRRRRWRGVCRTSRLLDANALADARAIAAGTAGGAQRAFHRRRGISACSTREWRGKDKATNVLSFPAFELSRPAIPFPPMLGDIVLGCVKRFRRRGRTGREALRGTIWSHLDRVTAFCTFWAHDHETDEDAEEMEAMERRALASLAIPDPYAITEYVATTDETMNENAQTTALGDQGGDQGSDQSGDAQSTHRVGFYRAPKPRFLNRLPSACFRATERIEHCARI